MYRRPPRLQSTATLFHYTTLFRSITDTSKFDVYGLHGESDRKNSNINWGLKSRVQQALRANSATECADPANGCVPINLFGDGTDISEEAIAFFNQPEGSKVSTRLSVVSGSLSGELGKIGRAPSRGRVGKHV